MMYGIHLNYVVAVGEINSMLLFKHDVSYVTLDDQNVKNIYHNVDI